MTYFEFGSVKLRKKDRTIHLKVLVLRKMRSFRHMKTRHVNLLLMTLLWHLSVLAQPLNDGCNQAIPLCPNVAVTASNQLATSTVCPDCEDDFTVCFSGDNTSWFTFQTNATGGNVAVNFSNLNFVVQATRGTLLQATILQATVPCDAASYTAIGNCEIGANGNFTLTALALPALTTYYVVVNGALNGGALLPAEASFDIVASGTGIDRVPAALSISGPGTTLCPNNPSFFNANVLNCTDTTDFSWFVNGTLVAITTGPYWQTSTIQDGDLVTLTCSCFTDCPQPMSAQYGPFSVENLFVNAGADQTILSGESVILSGTTNGITYVWTPSTYIAAPTSLQTIALPQTTTTYFLTASSVNCTLSDDVVITITDQLIIPGSFSPNDDGINDTWIIKGIDFYPNAHVTIFDRWGQEIEDIVGYSAAKSWDATHNGRAVTDGTYFYIVDLRDAEQKEPFKGFVTVIR